MKEFLNKIKNLCLFILKYTGSTVAIFAYFGYTSDKLMSIIWIKEASKWSLWFGMFLYSIYALFRIEKLEKQIMNMDILTPDMAYYNFIDCISDAYQRYQV